MAQNGIRTIDLPLLTGADDVLANSDGTTGRLSIEALLILVNSRLGPAYETLALLDADLDWPGGTLATVWGEADAALNGVYQKSGASGAGDWARIGDLPVSAISQALLDENADQVDLDAVADQVSAIAAGLSPAGEWDPNTVPFQAGLPPIPSMSPVRAELSMDRPSPWVTG